MLFAVAACGASPTAPEASPDGGALDSSREAAGPDSGLALEAGTADVQLADVDVADQRDAFCVGPGLQPPTFAPADGSLLAPGATVSIACPSFGPAQIFYTLDKSLPGHAGTQPTGTSQLYTAPIVLRTPGMTTIRAVCTAQAPCYDDSPVGQATYSVIATDGSSQPD